MSFIDKLKKKIYFVAFSIAIISLALPFFLHAMDYYVNDVMDGNEQWCTVPGNPGNSGMAPNMPKDIIDDIISIYGLSPGDRLFVDAGTYNEMIALRNSESGVPGIPVLIIGATNMHTVIDGTGNMAGIDLQNMANYIHIKNFTISNSLGYGIHVRNNAAHNNFENNIITANLWDGIFVDGAGISNIIYGNRVYNNGGSPIAISSSPQTVITRNTLFDSFPNDGILIATSSDCIVGQNLIYNCFEGIYSDSANTIIINNTLVLNSTGIYWMDNSSQLYDNITEGNSVYGYENSAQPTIIYTSCSWNDFDPESPNVNGDDITAGPEGNVIIDPLFVDPASIDYRLRHNSPLKARGTFSYAMGRYTACVWPLQPSINTVATYSNALNISYAHEVPVG